jgi:hypothetical protein
MFCTSFFAPLGEKRRTKEEKSAALPKAKDATAQVLLITQPRKCAHYSRG